MFKNTLNSKKSIILSPLVSIPLKILSILASDKSSVMDLRNKTTSPRVKQLLLSVSIVAKISFSSLNYSNSY